MPLPGNGFATYSERHANDTRITECGGAASREGAQPQFPIGLLTIALPPFVGVQIGAAVSLPIAVEPLVRVPLRCSSYPRHTLPRRCWCPTRLLERCCRCLLRQPHWSSLPWRS